MLRTVDWDEPVNRSAAAGQMKQVNRQMGQIAAGKRPDSTVARAVLRLKVQRKEEFYFESSHFRHFNHYNQRKTVTSPVKISVSPSINRIRA